MREDALARLKAAVLEQSLPRSQARDRQARAHREVDVAWQRGEVTCLDRRVLRQGAVASPVRKTEHPLSHRQPSRAITERRDHSGKLVPRDRWCPVATDAIGPGRRPRQLSRDESRSVDLNNDVIYRCLRLGPLHQLHPCYSRSLVRHYDRFHRNGLHSSRECISRNRVSRLADTSACSSMLSIAKIAQCPVWTDPGAP